MNRTMRTILTAGALVTVLILSGCTPNGGSIFYILENETTQPPSNLGTTIDVFDVVAPGTGLYYAAAGTIFVGSTSSGSLLWTPITHLDTLPVAGALCNALAYSADGNIYGGFYSPSGALSPDSLWQVNAAALAAGTGVWTAVTTVSGSQVVSLQAAAGGMLAVMATPTADYATSKDQPFTYSLWFNSGAGFTVILTGVTSAITGAWTSDGLNFYAVAGIYYYSGTAAAIGSSATSTFGAATIASPDALMSVYESGPIVYVTSKATGIYALSGGSWSNVAADSQSGTAVVYLGISGPVTGPSGGNILLGCEKYGYYSLNGTTLSRSADTTMLTLNLYYAVIRKLVIIGSDVFACTQGNGLWKGTLDPANPSGVSGWVIQ
jgi:hypothetical protein